MAWIHINISKKIFHVYNVDLINLVLYVIFTILLGQMIAYKKNCKFKV